MLKDIFKLKPKHKWFAAHHWDSLDEWYGPHNTIEAALFDCCNSEEPELIYIYVCQGRKITEQEKKEWGVEFDWHVDVFNGIKVIEHTGIYQRANL